MKICVFGLQHLGCVTSVCLADKGFEVIGLDRNEDVIENFNEGHPSVSEPLLQEILDRKLFDNLNYTSDIYTALKDSDIIWITFDTPVNKYNDADEIYVKNEIISLFPHLRKDTIILISSQLTVGTTRMLEEYYRKSYNNDVSFAYSPENLRHGKAVEIFKNPGRIVVGINEVFNIKLKSFMESLCSNILWMSFESAEMTKHALNSFLATEISFINEISLICERTGANIHDVQKGLMSDNRIGNKGFLIAGRHYTGGTLSRDVEYLNKISDKTNLKSTLIRSINKSNDNHKEQTEKS